MCPWQNPKWYRSKSQLTVDGFLCLPRGLSVTCRIADVLGQTGRSCINSRNWCHHRYVKKGRSTESKKAQPHSRGQVCSTSGKENKKFATVRRQPCLEMCVRTSRYRARRACQEAKKIAIVKKERRSPRTTPAPHGRVERSGAAMHFTLFSFKPLKKWKGTRAY